MKKDKKPKTLSDVRPEEVSIVDHPAIEDEFYLKKNFRPPTSSIVKSEGGLLQPLGGLWVQAKITDEEMKKKIKEGYVAAFSWAGRPALEILRWIEGFGCKSTLKKIHRLLDISVVTTPADLNAEFSLTDEAEGIIEGYVSTDTENYYYEVIEPDAFREAMLIYMTKAPKGTIFYNHDRDVPVGKILDWKIIDDEKKGGEKEMEKEDKKEMIGLDLEELEKTEGGEDKKEGEDPGKPDGDGASGEDPEKEKEPEGDSPENAEEEKVEKENDYGYPSADEMKMVDGLLKALAGIAKQINDLIYSYTPKKSEGGGEEDQRSAQDPDGDGSAIAKFVEKLDEVLSSAKSSSDHSEQIKALQKSIEELKSGLPIRKGLKEAKKRDGEEEESIAKSEEYKKADRHGKIRLLAEQAKKQGKSLGDAMRGV